MIITLLIALALGPAPAEASSPEKVLRSQLYGELLGSPKKSCDLMSDDYRDLFFEAATVIDGPAFNCPSAVLSLRIWRQEASKQFSRQAKRQIKARAKTSVSGNVATVTLRYRGLPPGWRGHGRQTREVYQLISAGDDWLVDAILSTDNY